MLYSVRGNQKKRLYNIFEVSLSGVAKIIVLHVFEVLNFSTELCVHLQYK